MSEAQYKALTFIHDHIQRTGHAPKQAQIARHVGRSQQVVFIWLSRFERLGYIKRRRGWLGIEVVRLPGKEAA